MQLAYLGLEVSNLSAWQIFARNILGLMQNESDGNTITFRMDEYVSRLILSEGPKDDLNFAGFALSTPDELSSLNNRLLAAGHKVNELSQAELVSRPFISGFYCIDPFGHRFEFGCGLVTELVKPFVSPTGVRFVAGDLGIGHIALSATDDSKAKEFYQNIMQFKFSDTINLFELGADISATFYHCNPRHHTLATLNVDQPKKLQHFMVELDDIDDVGRAYDRCMDQDIPLATTIGKHVNDKMISFYVISPSGFAVEVGTGGRLIDDKNWVAEHHETGSYWGHRVTVEDFVQN